MSIPHARLALTDPIRLQRPEADVEEVRLDGGAHAVAEDGAIAARA